MLALEHFDGSTALRRLDQTSVYEASTRSERAQPSAADSDSPHENPSVHQVHIRSESGLLATNIGRVMQSRSSTTVAQRSDPSGSQNTSEQNPSGTASENNRLTGECVVHKLSTTTYEFHLTLSDGRIYVRQVESQLDQAERSVGTALANLLAAIEEDLVVPNPEDASPLPAATDADEHDDTAEVPPADEPPIADNEASPKVEKNSKLLGEHATESSPPPPRVFLGVSASFSRTSGLTPHPGFGQFGAALGLSADFHSGLALGLTGGYLKKTVSSQVTLRRIPIIVWAGVARRAPNTQRHSLYLNALGGVGIDSWRVNDSSVDSSTTGSGPLATLAAKGAAAYHHQSKASKLAFTIGPALSLAYSGELSAGFGAATVHQTPAAPVLFRVGGLEANYGLQATIWFR